MLSKRRQDLADILAFPLFLAMCIGEMMQNLIFLLTFQFVSIELKFVAS